MKTLKKQDITFSTISLKPEYWNSNTSLKIKRFLTDYILIEENITDDIVISIFFTI